MQSRGVRTFTTGRRTFLKTVGATALAASAFSGAAAADLQFPHNNRNATTKSVAGPDGIETFVTTNRAGKPTMLGVWLPAATYDAVTASPAPAHYKIEIPETDGLNFTFAGVDWNPNGHPPAGVWTVPHFDFHFYLLEQEEVAAIPFGVPTYSIPDALLPEGYVTEDAVGAPDRNVIPGMGEHLLDAADPTPPYTYIYGAYDPEIDPDDPGQLLGYVDFATGAFYPPNATDVPAGAVPLYLLTSGDGAGELTFVEPMVTAAYMDSLAASDGELRQSVGLPEAFPEAGYYPTEYAVRYVGRADAFLVTLEEFEWFDGYAAA